MLGIIIQARLGSKRLPNKMILPFYGDKGIFELLIERIKNANLNVHVILATTTSSVDNKLVEIAKKNGIKAFRGSEINVLERYIKASEYYGFEKMIRICADNPFLDLNALRHQIKEFEKSDADYLCYARINGTPTIKTHFGFWAEGVKLKALKKIASVTDAGLYKEHVTNYIYTHPDQFSIVKLTIPSEVDQMDLRLTIDTAEDFNIAQSIYEKLIENSIPFNSTAIRHFIESRTDWLRVMISEIKKNEK